MTHEHATPARFRLHVPDETLRDLAERLGRTRWPDEAAGSGWEYGTDLSYLKSLVDHWRSAFDWRKHESEINRFEQYKVKLGGVDVHFIHEQGRGPRPLPLLISHGWPGSVFEFHKLIPMLVDPARFGADPGDAFTVVAPSLPGYTLSFAPGRRFSDEESAALLAPLMTDILGYTRFGTHGGDRGAFVTSRIACDHPESVIGIHLTLLAVRRDFKFENPSEEERRFLDDFNRWMKEESGYMWMQGTRPQTLAYGVTDSPVGLAAWMVEKFYRWTGRPDLDSYFGRDLLLTAIMLYWVTGSIGSSFWPYYARAHGPWPIPDRVRVPMGYAELARELVRPPRSVADSVYADIRRWSRIESGHFPALEQPEALAREIREFFKPLR
jgi:pimeloyl-ACP methyl ester carboxylesterase